MVTRPAAPATYEDILALPEHVVGQIIDGELVVIPRPTLRHARAATTLGSQLEGGFDRGDGGPGGWIVLFEPEVQRSRSCASGATVLTSSMRRSSAASP